MTGSAEVLPSLLFVAVLVLLATVVVLVLRKPRRPAASHPLSTALPDERVTRDSDPGVFLKELHEREVIEEEGFEILEPDDSVIVDLDSEAVEVIDADERDPN